MLCGQNNYSCRQMMEEEAETVQFYKIQLMEKEREISSFEAKMKKVELKHNRQLKEAKMGEERAKALLKEEKTKVDKFSKQAKENQQQNALLHRRVADIKAEKQKEVTEVRAQYNTIKEQIRNYERILPTLTFLNELNLTIPQIPTYEDLFIGLKEKTNQVDQHQQKIETLREQAAETMSAHQQTEQLLKSKKLQAENNFKEVLPKIMEYQQRIADLKTQLQDSEAARESLNQQLIDQKNRSAHFEQEMGEHENKIQEMNQLFNHALQQKEEQARGMWHQEGQRYEQEIKALSSRLEIKDNMYLTQLTAMEEQLNLSHARAQAEKEKWEQALAEVNEHFKTATQQLEQLKSEQQQTQKQNQQLRNDLIKVSELNEGHERLAEGLKKQLKDTKEQTESEHAVREISKIEEMRSLEEENQQWRQKYERVCEELYSMKEERDGLRQQNKQIRQQAINHHNEVNPHNTLQLPQGFLHYDERIRRKSIEELQEEEAVLLTIEKDVLIRERQNTRDRDQKIEELEKEIRMEKEEVEEGRKQIVKMTVMLGERQSNITELNREIDKLQTSNRQLQRDNLEARLKRDHLKKTIEELEESQTASVRKETMLKQRMQALEQQMKVVNESTTQEKVFLKNQKQEGKQLKEQINSLTEKHAKQTKKLNAEIAQLKQQETQVISQMNKKIKVQEREIGTLKKERQAIAKTQERLNAKELQLETAQKEIEGLLHERNQLKKEVQKLKQSVDRLQEENIEKDRQLEQVGQSLDRERRQRTLRTVPSLQSLQWQEEEAAEETFNDVYLTVTQKQGQINLLQREIADLKEQIESIKVSHKAKIQAIECENTEYVQTIIGMKMKCAEAEMRASEKEYLYSQLKKKVGPIKIQ